MCFSGSCWCLLFIHRGMGRAPGRDKQVGAGTCLCSVTGPLTVFDVTPAIRSLQPLGFQDHLNSLEVPALPLAASHPWGASLSALLRRREESSLILLGFCLTDAGGTEGNPQLSLATGEEDWASQGQPKRKPEIPVITLESRRNSRKSTVRVLSPGTRSTRGTQAVRAVWP